MIPEQDEVFLRIDALAKSRGRYRTQAYFFILSSIEFTVQRLGRGAKEGPLRHVSGQELSRGISDYAVQEFGPTARLVFSHWGLNETSDFGLIVYDLISVSLLGKNDTDDISDFNSVFDLDKEMKVDFKFKP